MKGLRIAGISKAFGDTPVLNDVSLDISGGEFITLLGPSGCGKSTLLRIIAGLESQDTGSIEIGDSVVDRLLPKQRDIAMVFQTYALYPHLTVEQNMALPLRMRRMSYAQRFPLLGRLMPGTGTVARDIAAEVKRVSEALEIGHLLDRKPGQLSGGQRQRVAVGRAMVRKPRVFLMDEPLSNLDAKLRVQMRSEIKDLHSRLGVTFIYVTHDQSEAMTLSDRVAVMLDGELLQVGTPQSIYFNPLNTKVATFIGSPQINLLPGRSVDSKTIETAGAILSVPNPTPPGTEITIGVRAESLRVAPPNAASAITGTIRLIEHLGSEVFLHLDIAGSRQPLVVRDEHSNTINHSIGGSVGVTPVEDGVLLFDASGDRIAQSQASVSSLRRHAK